MAFGAAAAAAKSVLFNYRGILITEVLKALEKPALFAEIYTTNLRYG